MGDFFVSLSLSVFPRHMTDLKKEHCDNNERM